jgi:hypothetical protein
MPIVGLFSGDVGIAAGLNYVLVFDRSGSTALGDLEHLFVGSFEFPK